MKTLLATAGALLAAGNAIAAESLQINAEDHGGGRYRVTGSVPGVSTIGDAQSILAPVFAQICQGQAVTLGRYTFEATQPLTGGGQESIRITQDLQCGSAQPLVHASAERPGPSAADEARVRAGTHAFLKARAAGEFETAEAMFSAETRRLLGEGWRSRTASVHPDEVAAGEPRLLALDWQDDPPGVPAGRYVAIDYVIDYVSGAVGCGYLAWRQAAPDRFEIVRTEEGHIGRAEMDALPVSQLADVRRKIGCRD